MTPEQQIQEILKEASVYGMRDSVETLAKSFLVDSKSAENKKFNFKPMDEVEAYEIAYKLSIQD